MGVIAIAAGLAGTSGQAMAAAGYASSAQEVADYVQFDLDGLPVKGWIWRSPFKEGDQVEVVGEFNGSHFEAAAIVRPSDHVVALYPHCSRGRKRHIRNAVKWWLFGASLFVLFVNVLGVLAGTLNHYVEALPEFFYVAIGCYAFFGLMTISLARKWMPFVRASEKVFSSLGWPNPSNVDLVKSTKARRKPDDPGELGTFYFRY